MDAEGLVACLAILSFSLLVLFEIAKSACERDLKSGEDQADDDGMIDTFVPGALAPNPKKIGILFDDFLAEECARLESLQTG
jgi:hypothetical protein